MGSIQNPAGAFGYPTPETPDGGFGNIEHRVLDGTVAAGDAVQLTGTLGHVIAQLTNGTALALFVGFALEPGVAGRVIAVGKSGPATVSKHAGAALTAGNLVGRSVTTAGRVALVATSAAITQAKDFGTVQGVVLEDAVSAATTVVIDIRGAY